MEKTARIYVAGHRGLVGSAILQRLQDDGYKNIITRTSVQLDLRDQLTVKRFFKTEKPEYVFLTAARVGGILANSSYPADFIYDNLAIELNVIHCCYLYKIKKLLFLGSSCIYPKFAVQPIEENQLLTGQLETTNEAYALAKIAGIKMCQAYNKQYGTKFISAMPANIYGPRDNFNLKTAHALPALLKKTHLAKVNKMTSVNVWGSGRAKREFLYVDDLAEACVLLMNSYEHSDIINIGTGEDICIAYLAELIKEVVGFEGGLSFDTSKPDGTPRKLLDVSKLENFGWKANTDLYEGIIKTYDWFLRNIESNSSRI